jgi:hypothetical protein
VLYCQAMQMAKQSANYLRVDEYDVKEGRLAISYWLTRDTRQPHRLGSKHKLIIYGEKSDLHGGLRTKHRPDSPELPRMDQRWVFNLVENLDWYNLNFLLIFWFIYLKMTILFTLFPLVEAHGLQSFEASKIGKIWV